MMSSRVRPVLCLALVLALSAFSVTGKDLSPHKRNQIDRIVQQVMQCGKIPALALSLVSLEDSFLYVKSYGTINSKSRTRTNTDTRFCLGGATEAFTAVLLAKLIQENDNVTWSTPIQDITDKRVVLPDIYRSTNLNLMDILAQRSGLPSMDVITTTNPFSSKRLVRNLRFVKPVAGFREKFVPNQVLFSLLEDVFQALGGDSWKNLLINHILTPLNMNSVMFLGEDDVIRASNLAAPTVSFNGKLQALVPETLKGLKLANPATTMCLSAVDMSKWIRFVLQGKGANNEQLLDIEVLKQTFMGIQPRGYGDDPEIVGYKQPAFPVSYSRELNALGWITGHYKGDHFVSQDGSIPGYQALATFLPSRNAAVFAAFTGDGGDKALAAKVILNMYGLDVIMRDNNNWFNDSQVCNLMYRMSDMHPSKSAQTPVVIRTSKYEGSRPLNNYVNQYRSYAYGDVMVKYNETDDPDLVMEYGQAVYKMVPTTQNDTFQLLAKGRMWYTTNADSKRTKPLTAVFNEHERDPENRISSLTVSGFDRNGDIEFSINPAMPRFEESREQDSHEDVECRASMTSDISFVFLLLVSIAVLFR